MESKPVEPGAPAPDPAVWPDIAGIDADDARRRWAGDAALFLGMLERFLAEYSSLTFPADDIAAGMRGDYARSIHKLRGGASILGASGIRERAEELALACGEPGRARAPDLAAALERDLAALRRSAAPAIQSLHARSAAAGAAPDPADAQRIVELIELLCQHSLAAAPRFSVLSSRLRPVMGDAEHGLLSDHIDALRFEAAAVLLAKYAPPAARAAQAEAADSTS